jgi:hypothetical protein
MFILKFIIAGLTIVFLTSCRRTNRLSDDDYKWMPYKGNETLVFNSNKGDIETFFFIRKDTLLAYPEAQSLNGIKYEVVSVFCKHSGKWDGAQGYRYSENYFVELSKSKDRKARLNFYLYLKDAWFYRLSGIKIDSLAQIPPVKLQTKYKTYNDIYVIGDEDWLNFKTRRNYITKLYWSISEGLVRFDKQDSVYWELRTKSAP